MSDKLRKKTEFEYGFKPNTQTRILRFFANLFVTLFRLNNNSALSTEIVQLLEPKSTVTFLDKKIFFKSGHGRLKWRADTFHTEEPLMISWLENFTEDDIFLDVGANVGTYSIPAGFLAKKVISIELDPINVYCLHTNIFLNNLQNKITILPLACGDKKSVQEIFYRDFSMGDSLQSVGRKQILPTQKNQSFTMQQFTITIDSLFEDYDLPVPTKIKIDVDGNEEIVLEGAWKTIAQAKEIYFEDNGLDSDTKILAKFSELGFSIDKELPTIVGSVKPGKTQHFPDIARNLILKKTT